MIENYISGKIWKDVTVTYFTLTSRLDSNTVPAKGKSDTLHTYSNLASNGGYPEVDKYRGLGAQIFAFHLNMAYVLILNINQAEMNSIRVSGIS